MRLHATRAALDIDLPSVWVMGDLNHAAAWVAIASRSDAIARDGKCEGG